MALIKCPNCGKEYSEHAEKCLQCGLTFADAEIKAKEKEEQRRREEQEREERRLQEEKQKAEQRENRRLKRKAKLKKIKPYVIAGVVIALGLAAVIFIPKIIEYYNSNLCIRKFDSSYYLAVDKIRIKKLDYESASPFYKGVSVVKKEGKWGVINRELKEVVPLVYDFIDKEMYNNKCLLVKRDNKWGALNFSGIIVLPIEYESIKFEKDLYIAQSNLKQHTVFNAKFQEIVSGNLDFSQMTNNIIITSNKGKYGCYSISGKLLLKNEFYKWVALRGGYTLFVSKNGKVKFLSEGEVMDRKDADTDFIPNEFLEEKHFYGTWETQYPKYLRLYIDETSISIYHSIEDEYGGSDMYTFHQKDSGEFYIGTEADELPVAYELSMNNGLNIITATDWEGNIFKLKKINDIQ